MERTNAQLRRGSTRFLCLGGVLALALALLAISLCSGVPAAYAYYDRGAVEVKLGTESLELQSGYQAAVTVSFTPSSDEQTEGCGMPKCPQMCGDECMDEDGQCLCSGTERKVYYPSGYAQSSNSSVAAAVCHKGKLVVYAKKPGEAVITVTGTMRQFSNGTAQLKVTVGEAGQVSNPTSSKAYVSIPAEAESQAVPKVKAVVNKIADDRPIRMVRIGEGVEYASYLADFAQVDGDVTYWDGDTYYQPSYSVTFLGTTFGHEPDSFDPTINVSTEATGQLNQPLYGLDGFVVLDCAQQGAWFAPGTVYVNVRGTFEDGETVLLFSYDADAKAFTMEPTEVIVSAGYASLTLEEGKTYVIANQDLTTVAAKVVDNGAAGGSVAGSAVTLGAAVPIVVALCILAVIVIVVILRKRGASKKKER